MSDPGQRPHTKFEPQRLLQLADLDDRDFTQQTLHYLAHPSADARALFHSDVLRRRTRHTVGKLLQLADKYDTKNHPAATREKWKAIRAAARAEREALQALPPEGAGPRRRALERLGQEHPDELAELRRGATNKNMRRSLLEKIARRYPVRMIQLLREERVRAA